MAKSSYKRIYLYQAVVLVISGIIISPAVQAQTKQKAGSKPLFMPTRDVTVVYAVQPENSPLVQTRKIYFSGGGKLLRIDGPNDIGMTIVNSETKTAIVIANKPRIYTVVPSKSDKSGLFLDGNMKFVKKGTERIAGILCRKWKATGTKGDSEVCITDDGVLLKQDGADPDGQEGKTQAISVNYDALPISIFQVPVGFQQVKLPENKKDMPILVSTGSPLLPMQAKPVDKETGVMVTGDQNPFITPQHDVDVVYALAAPMPGLPPFHQRMRWSVGQWKQRIDSQGVDTYMIIDYNNRTLTVLNPELKKKTTLPAPGEAPLAEGKRPVGDYIKVGEATVAGEHCTEWSITDSEGNPDDVCYTDDGVMLRVVRNNIPLVVAIKVVRAKQPASLFDVPAGLKELAPAHP